MFHLDSEVAYILYCNIWWIYSDFRTGHTEPSPCCKVLQCGKLLECDHRSHALRDTDEAPTMDYAEVIIAINLVCTSVKLFAAQEWHNIYIIKVRWWILVILYYVGLRGLGILINNRSRIENLRKTFAISCDANGGLSSARSPTHHGCSQGWGCGGRCGRVRSWSTCDDIFFIHNVYPYHKVMKVQSANPNTISYMYIISIFLFSNHVLKPTLPWQSNKMQ